MLPLILPLASAAIAAIRAVRIVQLVSRIPAAMRVISSVGRGAIRVSGRMLNAAGRGASRLGRGMANVAQSAGRAATRAARATGRTAKRVLKRIGKNRRDEPPETTAPPGANPVEEITESHPPVPGDVIAEIIGTDRSRDRPPKRNNGVNDQHIRHTEIIAALIHALNQQEQSAQNGGSENAEGNAGTITRLPIDVSPFIRELQLSRQLEERNLEIERERLAVEDADRARTAARDDIERNDKRNFMKKMLDYMGGKVKSVASSAVSAAKGMSLLDYAGLAVLGSRMLEKYFKDTYDKVVSFLDSAVSILSDPIGAIQEGFSSMASAIAEKTHDVLNGIKEWYEGSDLKGFVESSFNSMTNMFTSLSGSIVGLFKEWNLGEIWDKLTGWLENMWNDTKSFFGFGEPSEREKEVEASREKRRGTTVLAAGEDSEGAKATKAGRTHTEVIHDTPGAVPIDEMVKREDEEKYAKELEQMGVKDPNAVIPGTGGLTAMDYMKMGNSAATPSEKKEVFTNPLHTGTIGAAAKKGGMTGVDPRLQEIMDETAKEFPLRSRVVSGTGGRKGAHGDGRAMDITLFDQNGVALPNYQNSEHFRAYEMFAQAAYLKAKEKYPELADGKGQNFNWGGYFGDNGNGKYKYGSNDAMHYAIDDDNKFRASGAQKANPLQGLQGKYKGWYDKGDVLGGSKKYDPETFAADMEKLKNLRLTEEQARRAKASYYGVAKASGSLEKIPEGQISAAPKEEVSIDLSALDRDMAKAAQFAAVGDAGAMSDTNQTLSDPNQMIKGYDEPIPTPKPSTPVTAAPIKQEAKPTMVKEGKKLSYQEAFMKDIYERAYRQSGDHETALLLASQAALETGYGKHAPHNNLFGIKAHGKPGGNKMRTKEVVNGKVVWEDAEFAGYKDYDESIKRRLEFTEENQRYRKHGYFDAKTAEGKAQALQEAGYATDPKYAKKMKIISDKMRKMGLSGEGVPAAGTEDNQKFTINYNEDSEKDPKFEMAYKGARKIDDGVLDDIPENINFGRNPTTFASDSNGQKKSAYTGQNIMSAMRGGNNYIPFLLDKTGISSKVSNMGGDVLGGNSDLLSNLTTSIQGKIAEGLSVGTSEVHRALSSVQKVAGNVNVVAPKVAASSNAQHNSGSTSVGAPLSTRNSDSSIRRLTDSLLSYGLT